MDLLHPFDPLFPVAALRFLEQRVNGIELGRKLGYSLRFRFEVDLLFRGYCLFEVCVAGLFLLLLGFLLPQFVQVVRRNHPRYFIPTGRIKQLKHQLFAALSYLK